MSDDSALGTPEPDLDREPGDLHLPPLLSVDDASPEQVAALVAVFSSLGSEKVPPKPRSEWATPTRRLRTAYAHGPGAWRGSGLPR